MILHITVKPNSSKDSLEQISSTEYKANIKAPAENNKANIKLINLLAKHFKISATKIRIKNPTSRKKIIELSA